MALKIPVVKFNNGKTVPIIGLGTWKVSRILEIILFLFLEPILVTIIVLEKV